MKLKEIYQQIKKNFKEDIFFDKTTIKFKLGDVNFVIRSCLDIISYNDDGIYYTAQLKTIIEENKKKIDLPSCVIKFLMHDLNDDNGFIDEISETNININDFYIKMNSIIKKDREIEIDSFGQNHKFFVEFCKTYDASFSVLHIGIKKPKGVNLKIVRGMNNIIQSCVENASGYQFLVEEIIKNIEKNNYKKVGIFCRAGHHRSVAIVELLKKNLYPNAKIKHLHISK